MAAALKLDYANLVACADLDHWLAAPKTIGATIDLRHSDADHARSPPVKVTVEGYGAATRIQAYVERRDQNRFWLVFQVRFGAEYKDFYRIGSRHLNDRDPSYVDLCCGGPIPHDTAYQKRTAHACPGRFGRIAIPGLTKLPSAFFYEAACKFANVKYPTPSLVETHPTQKKLSGVGAGA